MITSLGVLEANDDVNRIQLCGRLRKLENSKLAAEVARSIAERKIAVIGSAFENQAKKMSRNLLLLSAEELVDANNFEAFTLAITELRKYSWTGKNAKRMAKLGALINRQNQGKLDL